MPHREAEELPGWDHRSRHRIARRPGPTPAERPHCTTLARAKTASQARQGARHGRPSTEAIAGRPTRREVPPTLLLCANSAQRQAIDSKSWCQAPSFGTSGSGTDGLRPRCRCGLASPSRISRPSSVASGTPRPAGDGGSRRRLTCPSLRSSLTRCGRGECSAPRAPPLPRAPGRLASGDVRACY